MAKGANGTIDLASFQQVTSQREVITNRNTAFHPTKSPELGVAANRLNSLFASSPLLESNRAGSDPSIDRGGLFSADSNPDGDIYTAYSLAIDPSEDGVSGYGFTGDKPAFLNYRHENNPFIKDENFNKDALTTGEAVVNGTSILHYKGFADLQPNELSSPAQEKENQTKIEISKQGQSFRDDLFGSDVSAYRNTQNSDLGKFTDGHDNTDSIGNYFKSKYTTRD